MIVDGYPKSVMVCFCFKNSMNSSMMSPVGAVIMKSSIVTDASNISRTVFEI